MAISDLPVLSALRTKMQWHQERQKVLSENVSNSDTPNFKPRDLVEPKFGPTGARGGTMGSLVMMQTTSGATIAASSGGQSFDVNSRAGFETRPAGNAVSLEDEMTKVATNQMDFQSASMLYGKGLGLIKIAVK